VNVGEHRELVEALRKPRAGTATATERDYESTIIDAARIGGWLVHAERPARSTRGWRTPIRGDAGWPDLFLAHPDGRALALELKRRPRRPTPEQVCWLHALALGDAIDARVVYVPDELDALVAELVGALRSASADRAPHG
jgi:hypothetical protein